jgi:hypothetical protein
MGGYIPYHLRTNKNIERQLFIELLKKINHFQNLSEYTYIGFGGQFLEEYKILYSSFEIKKMISMEIEELVHQRQEFNKPLSCIECLHTDSTSFIEEYNRDSIGATIIWLDYTNMDLYTQLKDSEDILNKLEHGDIFKITLNANPSNLTSSNSGLAGSELHKKRMEVYQEKVSEYFPPSVTDETMMTTKKYPKVLKNTLKIMIDKVFREKSLNFITLTSFVYEDGQQMFTLTGLVIDENSCSEFFRVTQLEAWKFFTNQDNEITFIDVPWLSVKEKTLIDQYMPLEIGKDISEIHDTIGLNLSEKNIEDSREKLNEYSNYFHVMPQFMKIST